MAISFEQPQSGPGAEQAAFGYGALQTKLATQPQQKDVFAAQVQANRDQLQANLGVNRDVFGAQVSAEQARERANEQVSRDSFAAQTQANRDQFQAQAQAEQSEQRFQQQQQLQESQANLQQQLSEAQLSQGEQLRMQRLDNTSDWLTNESGLQGEDLQDAIMQVRTGLDPLRQRQSRAQALASELQLQQVQQQQGLADAIGIEGDAARAEAFMRRNTFVDPGTGIRYGLDRNGSIAGTFDPETGEYVPYGVMGQRERAEAQRQQREEQAADRQAQLDARRQQQEQQQAERAEQQRQNQLATATQRTEAAVRNELTTFRRQSAANPQAAPPLWIASELEARTPSGGTKPPLSSLSADEINSLISDEVDARVRNTHGHLIGIDPNTWEQRSNSNPFALPGEEGNVAPPAPGRPPVQESPYLPPEVAARPSSISAERVSELSNTAQELAHDIGAIRYMRAFLPLRQLYNRVAGENRALTIAERAQAEAYVRDLRTLGATEFAAKLTPLGR